MIVNLRSDCVEVITHYAHGLQSGQIAMHLNNEFRPPYWLETLTAIIEHDDEQINFEKNNNLTALGFPSDFTLVESSNKDVLERCERVMEKTQHRSKWVSLLVSMHLEFIYADAIEADTSFKKFFKEQSVLRKSWRKIYGVTQKECADYYEVLRFCDRLSLIISQDQVPTAGRKLEINKSIAGERYFIYEEEELFKVEPSPFKENFTVTSEVYQLHKTKYASSDELQKHLLKSNPILKNWKFSK